MSHHFCIRVGSPKFVERRSIETATMSCQNKETIPMVVDTSNAVVVTKKEGRGFAALMVLCLALTLFVAGHACGSGAAPSAIRVRSGWTKEQQMSICSTTIHSSVKDLCGDTAKECLLNGAHSGGGGGHVKSCDASRATVPDKHDNVLPAAEHHFA